MSYALELNDAGLMLGRATSDGTVERVAESPAFALLENERVLTGPEAYARWRLRPRFAHNRYLIDVSTERLSRTVADVGTTADLAWRHLNELLRTHAAGAEVLLATPAGYTREQLALLLGILSECGVTVTGIVDAGLAAGSAETMPPRSAHLDLQLHRAVLTVLEHDRRGTVGRTHYEINPRVGVMPLQQATLQAISDLYVRKTRFDPMHEAQHEQLLADALPGLLDELQQAPHATHSIQTRSTSYSVELPREELTTALARPYADILQLVQSALRAHELLPLAVSHRLARWPGLLDALRDMPQTDVRLLAPEAAINGALKHAASIRRTPDALALITRLPATLTEVAAEPAARVITVPPEQTPTHVLYSGRAYAISSLPLTIGWSVPESRRALPLPAGVPGVSRAHCTLVRRNGAVVLEDHSTYGSFINDARVQGAGVLRLGDRLRLGAPGVTLEMIQLVQDDGSPAQV
jgi:hypothetical protein